MYGNITENKWLEDEENKIPVSDVLSKLKEYDAVFPVLHGKYGEDGAIAGLLELARVNYVGCKMLGSSIAMDKILSKELVNAKTINIVPYIALSNKEYNTDLFDKLEFINNINNKLAYPLIVKPNKEGSSYGVTKVDSEDEIWKAIEFAFKYDNDILIEKYISNKKEIECAVIEDTKNNNIYASTPGEILSANEFYDFNAKYENNKSTVRIPADINKETIEKIREYAKEIFKTLRLNSIARVDFFVKDETIYFNEVNTMPGFTNISMYPMMLINDNIPYSQILDILINSAKE